MSQLNNTINKVRDNIFKNIHGNNLIYNTCWEDPRCDREMLKFDSESRVVMITSAGCNALDYLLDNPQVIHSIDMNPRQNALLELKRVVIKHTTYEDLWKLFGEGYHKGAVRLYAEKIKYQLSPSAQKFWDRNIIHFTKKSFYFYGTSGTFAWLFNKYFRTRPKLRKLINQLLEAKSLEEQQEIYQKIEPKMINRLTRWFMNRHFTMSLLGVPRAQRQLIVDEYPGGLFTFITDALKHVFTELPIHDNYFWRLYLTGKYSTLCCPDYLRKENYEILKSRVDQIVQHTCTISDFLEKNPSQYTHYILLDHQDWLAAHNVPALNQEWELILQNSRPGTQFLMRSAAMRIEFLPEFALNQIEFEQELSTVLHQKDRVGTYGSVYHGTLLNKH
ncbi:MAG: BtaA family protein [Microscillaceae bacterium]|nr:BtaA family protein [Microscillaceae bacterium]